MATQPTQNEVPSESPRDLKFNAGKIDEFVTSLVNTYTDRFGNNHYTIEGLRWLAQQAISQFGWIPVESFQAGATISLPNQILKDTASGEYYRWDGALPKVVPVGSSPNSTGGTGVGAWISVGDSALRSMLSNTTSDALGDTLIGVKQPFTGAVARTQHSKNADYVNVKDFGATGDFNTTTQTGTDNTAAFQAALNYCKTVQKALYVPSGNYLINGNLTCDYAPTIFGDAGNGLLKVNSNHNPSPHLGTSLTFGNTSGYGLSINPAKYTFGMTLRDFSIVATDAARTSGAGNAGLYLNNVGWTGVVTNVNIESFGGSGLTLGYIQDTHFQNFTLLHCGDLLTPALDITAKSNYIYWDNCHFEACNWFLRNNNAAFLYFTNCHFENGDYNGAQGPDFDKYYSSPTIQLGTGGHISFTACIFVPASDAFLASSLGVATNATPFFMSYAGPNVSFSNCKFLAPRDGISPIATTGGTTTAENTTFTQCMFIGLSAQRYAIDVYKGRFDLCTFSHNLDTDTTGYRGINISRGGCVDNCKFTYTGTVTTRRSVGYLINTGTGRYDSINITGNTYPATTIVCQYVNPGCTIVGGDGGVPYMENQSFSAPIDLSKYPPSANFWLSAALGIGDITNAPYGATVKLLPNVTGITIAATSNVVPYGNAQYTATANKMIEFQCVMDASGNRKLYQTAG
ncbi:glycosyl hydrolase family 28-related protein [Cronobacter turicensis]